MDERNQQGTVRQEKCDTVALKMPTPREGLLAERTRHEARIKQINSALAFIGQYPEAEKFVQDLQGF